MCVFPFPCCDQTELGLTSLRLTKLISAVRLKLQPNLSLGMVLKHRIISVDTLAAAVLAYERKVEVAANNNANANGAGSLPRAGSRGAAAAQSGGSSASSSSSSPTDASIALSIDSPSSGAATASTANDNDPAAAGTCGETLFAVAQFAVYAFRLALLAIVMALWRILGDYANFKLGVAADAYLVQALVLCLCTPAAMMATVAACVLLCAPMTAWCDVLQPLVTVDDADDGASSARSAAAAGLLRRPTFSRRGTIYESVNRPSGSLPEMRPK